MNRDRTLSSVVATWVLVLTSTGCLGEELGGAVAAGGGGADGASRGGVGPGEGKCSTADPFVQRVRAVSYGPGQDWGRDAMPEIVLGPPRGGGCCQGSTDVVSLGNGGSIELGFGGQWIVDGDGVDLVVFENAFEGPAGVFAELGTVEVSADGSNWDAFPCDATAAPYGSCAGWHPVYLDGPEAELDADTAGGDGFDLADIGVPEARYVRITDRADIVGMAGVFDLDAVGVVHAACR